MKTMAAVLLSLMLAVRPITAAAATSLPPLTRLQEQMELKAYFIGGPRLAAIILHETSACRDLHSTVDSLACGCGGTHAATATGAVGSDVACSFLDLDWDFSMRVAALYLDYCTELFGYEAGIACYNVGIPKARTMTRTQLRRWPYVKAIEQDMYKLRHLPVSRE
jgi:hypothetical protein